MIVTADHSNRDEMPFHPRGENCSDRSTRMILFSLKELCDLVKSKKFKEKFNDVRHFFDDEMIKCWKSLNEIFLENLSDLDRVENDLTEIRGEICTENCEEVESKNWNFSFDKFCSSFEKLVAAKEKLSKLIPNSSRIRVETEFRLIDDRRRFLSKMRKKVSVEICEIFRRKSEKSNLLIAANFLLEKMQNGTDAEAARAELSELEATPGRDSKVEKIFEKIRSKIDEIRSEKFLSSRKAEWRKFLEENEREIVEAERKSNYSQLVETEKLLQRKIRQIDNFRRDLENFPTENLDEFRSRFDFVGAALRNREKQVRNNVQRWIFYQNQIQSEEKKPKVFLRKFSFRFDSKIFHDESRTNSNNFTKVFFSTIGFFTKFPTKTREKFFRTKSNKFKTKFEFRRNPKTIRSIERTISEQFLLRNKRFFFVSDAKKLLCTNF